MGSKKIADYLSNLYLVLCVSGFLFIGTVPSLIGVSEGSLTVPYKLFMLIFSLFLIFLSINSGKFETGFFNKYFLFLTFWLIYSIRIIYDLLVDPIHLHPEKSTMEYLQFAFGAVFIPCVAVIFIKSNKLDFDWILKWIYRMIFFTLFVAIYFRGGSEATGRDVGEVNVGVLFFGHLGATLSILSIFQLLEKKNNTFNKILYIVGFILGFVGIIVSASKSPFLALSIVLFVYIVFRFNALKLILILSIIAIFLNYYFIEIITFLGERFNSNFFWRLTQAIEVGGDESRQNIVKIAFNEFIENPFIGNAMLIQSGEFVGWYPHNLIIEALMATGVLGGVFFIAWVIKCLKATHVYLSKSYKDAWVSLLFLQYFIFGMFSKNLYSNDLFWIFTLLLFSIQPTKNLISKLNQK